MAAYEETQTRISINAGKNIGIKTGVPGTTGAKASKQYYFVALTGENEVDLVDTSGADAVGVLGNKPQAKGAAATVVIGGVCLVTASGAVSAGDKVSSDADGKGQTASSGDTALGLALYAAAADGDLFPVLLSTPAVSNPA